MRRKGARSTSGLLAIVASLLFTTATGLDVAVRGLSCDESLPVYVVQDSLQLNGSQSCTFGETILVQGQLAYNGVQDVELDNYYVSYLSGEFDVSVDMIDFFTPMNVCYDSVVAISGNTDDDSAACPGDGTYDFEAVVTLPSYENSWWATGWRNSGHLHLYADEYKDYLIGSCSMTYVTGVTSSDPYIHVPSAMLVSIMALIPLGLAAGYILHWMFVVCRSKKGSKDDEDGGNKYFATDAEGNLSRDSGSSNSKHGCDISTSDDCHSNAASVTRWKFRVLKVTRHTNDKEEQDSLSSDSEPSQATSSISGPHSSSLNALEMTKRQSDKSSSTCSTLSNASSTTEESSSYGSASPKSSSLKEELNYDFNGKSKSKLVSSTKSANQERKATSAESNLIGSTSKEKAKNVKGVIGNLNRLSKKFKSSRNKQELLDEPNSWDDPNRIARTERRAVSVRVSHDAASAVSAHSMEGATTDSAGSRAGGLTGCQSGDNLTYASYSSMLDLDDQSGSSSACSSHNSLSSTSCEGPTYSEINGKKSLLHYIVGDDSSKSKDPVTNDESSMGNKLQQFSTPDAAIAVSAESTNSLDEGDEPNDGPLLPAFTTALSIDSGDSSSVNPLEFLENNQAPKGQVQGLISYTFGGRSASFASTPAPSSIHPNSPRSDKEEDEEEEAYNGDQDGGVMAKVRRMRKSITRSRASSTPTSSQQSEASCDGEKHDSGTVSIQWEKVTQAEYHQFDVV